MTPAVYARAAATSGARQMLSGGASPADGGEDAVAMSGIVGRGGPVCKGRLAARFQSTYHSWVEGVGLRMLRQTSMPKIFISYRRDDSEHITGRIYDHLEPRFGHDNVFMDVDAMLLGVDFR